MTIQQEIERILQVDREEAACGEVVADELAVARCLEIAGHIAGWLAPSSDLTWAAFGAEAGGVELLLHSKPMQRQVTFEIMADGTVVSAIRIDEEMCRQSKSLTMKTELNRKELRELAAWCAGQL